MCVFLEYAGSWPAECAYFSSMEAPGKLDVRISRVLASCMCVCTGQREPRALGWAGLGWARLGYFLHTCSRKKAKKAAGT